MTTNAFVIRSEPDDYDALLPIRRPGGWSPVFNTLCLGVRRGDSWTPVPVERYRASRRTHRGRLVDFPSLGGLGLAFSERALRVLEPLAGDTIEALPLAYEGPGRFYVINILDIASCLDLERSELNQHSDGYICTVKRYVFKPGSIDGKHIFKCKECELDDLVSAEFKALVEEQGLVGASFTPVGD